MDTRHKSPDGLKKIKPNPPNKQTQKNPNTDKKIQKASITFKSNWPRTTINPYLLYFSVFLGFR